MRQFKLVRNVDVSGVSGTGHVAEGVQFGNGKCVLNWLTQYSSVAIYDDIETRTRRQDGGRLGVQ